MSFMNTVTQFGDLAVLLPLVVTLAAALLLSDGHRASAYLLVALAGCLALMGLLKLFFLSCGGALGLAIASPSGHAAASTFVLGSVCVVVTLQLRGLQRIIIFAATVAAIIAIDVSRVVLGAHSIIEVLIGTAVGALCLALFALPYAGLPRQSLKLGWLGCGALLAALVLHGCHLPIEELLRQSATTISKGKSGCF